MKNIDGKSSNKMQLLKQLDIFGEQVIFTFQGKTTMKSYLGLILTIILCGIGIFMFFFMGQSFFFSINPQSYYTASDLSYVPSYNTKGMNTMFIAVRARSGTKEILLDGTWAYGLMTMYTPNNPNSTQRRIYFMPTLCSDMLGIDRTYYEDNNLANFYCYPISEEFGGDPSAVDYRYFTFSISLCTATTHSTCDVATTNKIAVGQISIEIKYPRLYFDPNNYANPIEVKHKTSTDNIQPNSYIMRSIYMKNTTMHDDKGWLLEENNVNSYVTVGEENTLAFYKESTVKLLHSTYIYIGSQTEKINRKYQKLQDVVAVVGGFIKICQFIFKILMSFYIKYLKSHALINSIIKWLAYDKDSEIGTSNHSNNEFNRLNQMNQNMNSKLRELIKDRYECPDSPVRAPKKDRKFLDIEESTLLKLRENKSPEISNLSNLDKNQNISPEKNKGKFDFSASVDNSHIGLTKIADKQLDKNKSRSNKNETLMIKHEQMKKNKHGLFSLSFREVLGMNFCRKRLKNNEIIKVKLFQTADQYVKAKLDILGYFNLVDEVKAIKEIVMNKYQNTSLHFAQKPHFYYGENMNEIELEYLQLLIYQRTTDNEQEKKKLTDYYAYKIHEKKLNSTDVITMTSLDDEMANSIVKRINDVKEDVRQGKEVVFNNTSANINH